MNTHSETNTTSGGYVVRPADDTGTLWFIFGPSGDHIGSCATREGALRLVSIVGGGAVKPRENVAPGSDARAAEVGAEAMSSARPLMFEWYAPEGRGVLSVLEKFLRLIGAGRR